MFPGDLCGFHGESLLKEMVRSRRPGEKGWIWELTSLRPSRSFQRVAVGMLSRATGLGSEDPSSHPSSAIPRQGDLGQGLGLLIFMGGSWLPCPPTTSFLGEGIASLRISRSA